MAAPDVLKVSELVNKIKGLLEGSFASLSVEGEISNLSHSAAGHSYFTLSDAESSVQVALFRMDALRNPLIKQLNDGDKIICHGAIGVYSKKGTFQIIARLIQKAGKGDILERFEKLKEKLRSEGLFDVERKRPIPKFPQKIAIVTAQRGAALQDFLNVFSRRGVWMNILVVNAVVQGDDAPRSLINALEKIRVFNETSEAPVDVVVMARGGGSMEDLWAFNDESLARVLAAFPVPVVSAVGHEVDYSICDFVSDLRCETPSAAAEVLSAPQIHVLERMKNARERLLSAMRLTVSELKGHLDLVDPRKLLEKIIGRFIEFSKRLNRCDLTKRFLELIRVHEKHMELDDLLRSGEKAILEKIRVDSKKVEAFGATLFAIDPVKVLARGFSFVTDENNVLLPRFDTFEKLVAGKRLKLHFVDGTGKVEKV